MHGIKHCMTSLHACRGEVAAAAHLEMLAQQAVYFAVFISPVLAHVHGVKHAAPVCM